MASVVLLSRCVGVLGIGDVAPWNVSASEGGAYDVAHDAAPDAHDDGVAAEAAGGPDAPDGMADATEATNWDSGADIRPIADALDAEERSDGPDAWEAGTPTALAWSQSAPWDIKVDSENVYFTNFLSQGDIVKVPIDGGAPTTLASGQAMPIGLAIDAANVYWTNIVNPGTVMRAALDGGSPVTVGTGPYPCGVAVNDSALYWGQAVTPGALVRQPLDGAAPVTISATGAGAVSLGEAGVYWTVSSYVYSAPLGGGAMSTVAIGQAPFAVAVSSSWIVWTDYQSSGSVNRVPLDGGPGIAIASARSYPSALAIDETNAYWTESALGTVVMTRLDGSGSSFTLASGQNAPHGITVDGSNVYWTNNGDGTVMKLAKP